MQQSRDDRSRAPKDGTATGFRLYPTVVAIALACTVIEVVLAGADLGFWGSPEWRRVAIEEGGFWAGLLDNWQPNYRLQPMTMFISYAFLHSGPSHFLVNMLTLFSLGTSVADRVGQGRFSVIYLGSAIGGGLGFAALFPSTQPMVGASGALFGLFGALVAWEYDTLPGTTERRNFMLRTVLILAGLNLVLWLAMHGLLAWQTHLGGFVAGWLLAFALQPKGREHVNN